MNTVFYIYDDIRLKEISIMNALEQIQENTVSGSAFSARQLGRGFHTRPTEKGSETVHQQDSSPTRNVKTVHRQKMFVKLQVMKNDTCARIYL